MTLSIRGLVMLAALLAVVQASPSPAQDYPTRPVTLIAPWAAGGAVDTVARIVAPRLAERLGKPVVIENRPGGGSTIGTAVGAKAPRCLVRSSSSHREAGGSTS
jgi:tripartite-type tricarboxylate transporter receptor subunit TctC